jgi:hypothetical protein
MEATCSSETSVDFQRTTRRYVPEDMILQSIGALCTLQHKSHLSSLGFTLAVITTAAVIKNSKTPCLR